MPSSSQEVRNHIAENIQKIVLWYLPSPSTFEISSYKGDNCGYAFVFCSIYCNSPSYILKSIIGKQAKDSSYLTFIQPK